MRIAHIVGNRPQFVKLSLLQRSWMARNGNSATIIHTGQHFSDNMSAIFFREFNIPPPDHQLHINNRPHGEMIGQMLIALNAVLSADRPDAVVVYGDTNTTLAGALAAKKLAIPLVHVEAGIRTGQENMPEESNRYLTDRMATLNFTCTRLGLDNLRREGLSAEHIFNTGDLMFDAAMYFKDQALAQYEQDHTVDNQPFVLATIHRAENTGDPAVLRGIMEALEGIHQEIPVVFPAHPYTMQLIGQYQLPKNIRIIPALGYFDMLALIQSSSYVITDSGGLSREAFFFRKPGLIVMENPFWPEILDHGPSMRTTAGRQSIISTFARLRSSTRPFEDGIFGDGHAAEKITDLICNNL